mmetsp:Transcript_15564/g.39055  ORF Transcript_15564/g.39055 Transcript_15564/m.39055 type:complete len:212 (-) Transcript_15564:174-809(-)
MDAGKREMGAAVADRHDEVVNAQTLAVDDELRNDHRRVGASAKRARPELGRREGGRIDLELLRLRDVRRRRLERTDVGAMPELCLCVASDHSPRQCLRQPACELLLVTELLDVRNEHERVDERRLVVGDGVEEHPALVSQKTCRRQPEAVQQSHHCAGTRGVASGERVWDTGRDRWRVGHSVCTSRARGGSVPSEGADGSARSRRRGRARR